jgi:phosphohistidine phosphatase
MEIHFLRHGPAGPAAPGGGARDRERPLTPEGSLLVASVGQGLRRLGLRFDAIASSPLLRARQTADLIADALGERERVLVTDALSMGFSLGDLAELVKAHRTAERFLLVGHEPDLSCVAGELIGGGCLRFRKASIARVDLDEVSPGAGRLRWLLEPEMAALYARLPAEDR